MNHAKKYCSKQFFFPICITLTGSQLVQRHKLKNALKKKIPISYSSPDKPEQPGPPVSQRRRGSLSGSAPTRRHNRISPHHSFLLHSHT